jgi:adenosyl cobinamide kinase/adenosyl cobinamide phosphate guanylyltransferase
VLREWREAHGRMMNALSREADGVVRLFCGIPQVLK